MSEHAKDMYSIFFGSNAGMQKDRLYGSIDDSESSKGNPITVDYIAASNAVKYSSGSNPKSSYDDGISGSSDPGSAYGSGPETVYSSRPGGFYSSCPCDNYSE